MKDEHRKLLDKTEDIHIMARKLNDPTGEFRRALAVNTLCAIANSDKGGDGDIRGLFRVGISAERGSYSDIISVESEPVNPEEPDEERSERNDRPNGDPLDTRGGRNMTDRAVVPLGWCVGKGCLRYWGILSHVALPQGHLHEGSAVDTLPRYDGFITFQWPEWMEEQSHSLPNSSPIIFRKPRSWKWKKEYDEAENYIIPVRPVTALFEGRQ